MNSPAPKLNSSEWRLVHATLAEAWAKHYHAQPQGEALKAILARLTVELGI